MHTPDQARELWCPMVRVARRESVDTGGEHFQHMPTQLIGGVNHDALGGSKRMAADHQPLASCRCIADKCGMWRWDNKLTVDDDIAIEQGTFNAAEMITRQLKGFCGLAGLPGAAV